MGNMAQFGGNESLDQWPFQMDKHVFFWKSFCQIIVAVVMTVLHFGTTHTGSAECGRLDWCA